jgi:hypothetical protein
VFPNPVAVAAGRSDVSPEVLGWITIAANEKPRPSSVLLDVDRRQLLDSLPYAEDAAFDSRVEEGNPTCHPRTRSSILSDIHQWAEDP